MNMFFVVFYIIRCVVGVFRKLECNIIGENGNFEVKLSQAPAYTDHYCTVRTLYILE